MNKPVVACERCCTTLEALVTACEIRRAELAGLRDFDSWKMFDLALARARRELESRGDGAA
jgi:hypothetical protein